MLMVVAFRAAGTVTLMMTAATDQMSHKLSVVNYLPQRFDSI